MIRIEMLNVGRKYSLNDIKEQVNIKLEELQKKGAEIVNVNGVSNTNGEVSCMIIQYKNPKCEMKKCEHCGKYFIPQNRSDEKYCNNLYKDTGKTCKEIGAMNTYKNRLENDEALKKYRNFLKRNSMRESRSSDENEKHYYKKWNKYAKIHYAMYKENKLRKEEFIEWLDKTSDYKSDVDNQILTNTN